MEKFDLAVIGGGPGGYVSAIKGAQLGLKVVLFEKEALGGVCLNRGCIPTKTMIHAAQMLAETASWAETGLSCREPSFDMAGLLRRKEAVIGQMAEGIAALLKANKVKVVKAQATVTGSQSISAAGEDYQVTDILIAAGSYPLLPPLPGIDLPGVVTSDDMLAGAFYKRLIIIGGGVIGMEFACLYQALGCQITVIEAMDRILPTVDRELGQNLSMIVKKKGVDIHTGCRVSRIEQRDGELVCTYNCRDKQEEAAADGVLVAIGRRGCAEGLFAPGLEVAMEKGQLVVDENHRTTLPHVYAVGDVAKGDVQLAHAASAYGVNTVCHIAGQPPQLDMAAIPACIFVEPEIAVVGITADEAKAEGIAVNTAKYLMSGNGKSIIEMADRGFIKLVAEADSGRLLGAQMMCCHAADLINELALAVKQGLTAEDVASLIHPHPTFGEGVQEAAECLLGRGIHTMPRRR